MTVSYRTLAYPETAIMTATVTGRKAVRAAYCMSVFIGNLLKQESPADAGIPARRKNDEKIPPLRSYNKF